MKRVFPVILSLLLLEGLVGCRVGDRGKIISVGGQLDPEALGITLVHEHLLVDFIGADATGYHRWDRDSVVDVLLPYLIEAREQGVRTLVECTPAFLGRDPVLLRRLEKESGLQLLTNTGYYGAHKNKFIPDEVFDLTAEQIAEKWIEEFREGIEGTGVRPGFIKIAVDAEDSLSAEHRLLIRAAGITHNATGMRIYSHTGPDAPAFNQIEALEQMGVPADAFVWVHAQGGTLEGVLEAAERGAWISLDNVNPARDVTPGSVNSTAWYADRIKALKDAGYLDRVLVSHDAGWYRPGEPGGGKIRGFTGIFTALIPALQERGFSQEEIDILLVQNPAKLLAIG